MLNFNIDFNLSPNVFLGIDIGTSAIKIAEIKIENDKPVLSNYAWLFMNESGKKDESFSQEYFKIILPDLLRKMLQEANIKTKNSYVSVPAFGGLITTLDLPEVPSEELEQAVRFEAHKYIPSSLDEVVINWDILGKKKSLSETAADRLEVLLVAAPKNTILKYEKLLQDVRLKLRSVEIETFPLVNALVGNDPGNFIIVDIGHRVCNIVLVEKGVVKVNRNIDAGGRDITRTIARSMGVEEERAEKMKLSEKNLFSRELDLHFSSLDLINREVSRVINNYLRNDEGKKIDGIILAGGTANMTGIKEYLAEVFKLKIIVGNPFSRVVYDQRLKDKLEEMKPYYSVAMGLALKGAEEYLRDRIKNKGK